MPKDEVKEHNVYKSLLHSWTRYSRDAGGTIIQMIERKVKVSMTCRGYVVLKFTT